MYRDFWIQGFITGKTFDKSRKSLFILQEIPVILRFPVDLTGNPYRAGVKLFLIIKFLPTAKHKKYSFSDVLSFSNIQNDNNMLF